MTWDEKLNDETTIFWILNISKRKSKVFPNKKNKKIEGPLRKKKKMEIQAF